METKKSESQADNPSTTTVTVHFRAIGEAPALQKDKYKVNAGPTRTLLDVQVFLRKLLGHKNEAALFIYCGPGFAPTPDQKLIDLHDCFASGNGELSLYYAFQQTWG